MSRKDFINPSNGKVDYTYNKPVKRNYPTPGEEDDNFKSFKLKEEEEFSPPGGVDSFKVLDAINSVTDIKVKRALIKQFDFYFCE